MCCGKRLLVFAITFGLGTCLALIFNLSQNKINRATVTNYSNPHEISKLKCKEKSEIDRKLFELLKKQIEIQCEITSLELESKANKDLQEKNFREIKSLSEKVEKLRNQYKIREKETEKNRLGQTESKPSQNLLYIENCSEY